MATLSIPSNNWYPTPLKCVVVGLLDKKLSYCLFRANPKIKECSIALFIKSLDKRKGKLNKSFWKAMNAIEAQEYIDKQKVAYPGKDESTLQKNKAYYFAALVGFYPNKCEIETQKICNQSDV
eukprot:889206_1